MGSVGSVSDFLLASSFSLSFAMVWSSTICLAKSFTSWLLAFSWASSPSLTSAIPAAAALVANDLSDSPTVALPAALSLAAAPVAGCAGGSSASAIPDVPSSSAQTEPMSEILDSIVVSSSVIRVELGRPRWGVDKGPSGDQDGEEEQERADGAAAQHVGWSLAGGRDPRDAHQQDEQEMRTQQRHAPARPRARDHHRRRPQHRHHRQDRRARAELGSALFINPSRYKDEEHRPAGGDHERQQSASITSPPRDPGGTS